MSAANTVNQEVTKSAQGELLVPARLAEVMTQRIQLLMQLDQLDAVRRDRLENESLCEKARSEYLRQTRELQRVPDGEKARDIREKLEARAEKARLAAQDEAKQGPSLDEMEDYFDAVAVGCRQLKVFESHAGSEADIYQAATDAFAHEPTWQLFQEAGIEAQDLFAWTVYAVALEKFAQSAAARSQDESVQSKPDESDESLMISSLVKSIKREQKSIELPMVETFWRVYRDAALAFVTEEWTPAQMVLWRSFLRYGLMIQSDWFISPEISREMLKHAIATRDVWEESVDATHLLYADEYIWHVVKGHLTPSLDEDLELNNKGSDLWRLDKNWRRKVSYAATEQALLQTIDRLQKRVNDLEVTNEKLDAESKAAQKGNEFRGRQKVLREEMQNNKVEIARLQRAIEIIKDQRLPELYQHTGEVEDKLGRSDIQMTPEKLVDREVAGIRRMCRLTAKLKEPFLPMITREYFKPGTPAVNDKAAMSSEIKDIEYRDPDIFREITVPGKKRENRVYTRFSPYIILMPCRGLMCMSWNPRGGTEVGRIAVPMMNMRPGSLTRMLYDVMADFRWDTSKESAGVDLMKSETLVAGYATVRWNYRKRSKEIREKALIFNEIKDRPNWRRHYLLYMQSADDGGKKLFFKCRDIYEVVLQYMGLPDGVERCKD